MRRARPLLAIAAVACALAAGTAQAADGGDAVGGDPLTSLGSVETIDGSSESDGAPAGGGSIVPTGDPLAPGADPAGATPGGVVPGGTAPGGIQPGGIQPGGIQPGGSVIDPATPEVDGDATEAELTRERDRLVAERDDQQTALLRHEANRQQADLRVDAALDAIAQRLVDLFDEGRDARLEALMAVRNELDPTVRTQLVAALDPADRALVAEHDAATAAAASVGERAEAVRSEVLALGTRVAAIDALLDERAGPTAAELARERGDRYTFDADYVFATGPIPGIGYWGAASSSGSALSGWMGYASAAVGGIGCDPTDPALRPTGSVESGEASWYGPGFDGNPTANGEPFDTTQLTAAHRTLPFGTIVRVYSSSTARCVFVRINDRGPFIDGRMIDLSRAAADAIGMESVAPVQLEVYSNAAAPAAS